MSSNPPTPAVKSGINRQILGFPLWAWGAGATAFVIGVVIFFRSQSSSASNNNSTMPNSTNTGIAIPVPFATSNTSASTSATSPPVPNWQFGPQPTDGKTYVWHLTDVGKAAYKDSTGQTWPGGVYPGTTNPMDVMGGLAQHPSYSWQWAPVPTGWTQSDYANALGTSGLGAGPVTPSQFRFANTLHRQTPFLLPQPVEHNWTMTTYPGFYKPVSTSNMQQSMPAAFNA